MLFSFSHGLLAEVENGGGQDGICSTVHRAANEMVQISDSATGDERHGGYLTHRLQHPDVEAVPGAVTVHGGQQNLACASVNDLVHPTHEIQTGRAPSTVSKHFKATRRSPTTSGIYGHHHTLTAELSS